MSKVAALQDGIYTALGADAALTAQVGARIYDNAPAGVAYPYITFGPSDSIFADAEDMDADEISFQVDVWVQGAKRTARAICGLVEDALAAGVTVADPYALQHLHVERVRVIEDLLDGVSHGVVTVSARVEDTA